MSVNNDETKDLQLVEIINEDNRFFVSSRLVAEHFGKRHKHVLRDIEKIRSNIERPISNLVENTEITGGDVCEPNFGPTINTLFFKDNFELKNYQVIGPRGGVRQESEYLLTRDGFSLLAMGFTGKAALDWKVKYIKAFKRMEAALREDQLWVGGLTQALERICPTPPVEAPSVQSQRAVKTLRALSAYWAMIETMPQTAAETAVCAVGKIQQLDDFDFARHSFHKMYDFLERVIALSSERDKQPATEQQIQTIKYLVDACAQFRYSRDRNIYELLLTDYGISVETILAASSGQAKRIAATVYTLLRQQDMQTLVINEIKRRAKKADDKKKLPKGGEQP